MKKNEERNQKIAKDYYENGVRAQHLAKVHNVSTQRIYIIVEGYRVKYENKQTL